MIWMKVLLLIVLAVVPMIPVVLALPRISTAAIVILLGFWIVEPSWGLRRWLEVVINISTLPRAARCASPSGGQRQDAR